MKRSPLTHTLLIAGAVTALAAGPAAAQGPGGHRSGDDSALLDNDFTLTSTESITSAGKTSTHTFTDDDGDSHTVTKVRGAKASGDVTSDLKTAAGGDPGALAGALKYTTRSGSSRGSFSGILTVTSSGGKLRLKLSGRSNGDGSYDARVRRAKGTGDFADADVAGDVDVTVAADSVAIDLDGEYGYDDSSDSSTENSSAGAGGGRGDCPRGGQSDDSGSNSSSSESRASRRS